MDITEIIERLKNIAGHAVHTVGEEPFVMSLDDGIAVHEAIELLKKAETNCSEIPNGWIPVSERLPKEGQGCLVCDKGHILIDTFIGHGNPYNWKFYVRDYEAWMPLPEPYKEGEQHETD